MSSSKKSSLPSWALPAAAAVAAAAVGGYLYYSSATRSESDDGGAKPRMLGRTGFKIMPVGIGTWQFGGCWSKSDADANSRATLNAFLDAGGNFIDTANVYGADYGEPRFGWSESVIGEVLSARKAAGKDKGRRIFVATKAGRAPTAAAPGDHGPERYTYAALAESIAGSAKRLKVSTVDLLQLHCPPIEVLRKGDAFDHLRRLQREGKIMHWGVSVETVEEGLLSVAQPDCATVQIIFNMLRLKPAVAFLGEAEKKNVGTIIRVPYASGLLTGKVDMAYVKSLDPDGDHRVFNTAGASFDKGETWSGLGEHLEDIALPAVAELKAVREAAVGRGEVPATMTMAQFALKWILDHSGVSVVIPGCRTTEQALGNLGAAPLPSLSKRVHAEVKAIYDGKVKAVIEAEKW